MERTFLPQPHRRMTGISRRAALRLGGGGLAAVAGGVHLAAAAPGARAQEDAPAPFMGETYVGGCSDPYLLAAVVIGEAEAGAAERPARAYLCKTPVHMPGGIDEWLEGTLANDTLELEAESGVRLVGKLEHGAVTGTVTVADGVTVALLANRAMGTAGLYVGARTDRLLRATSAEGGSLEELVSAVPDETFELPEYWQIGHDRQAYPAVALITPPEGPPTVITTYYDSIDDADRLRVIVLNDGRHNGAGPNKSGDFTCRELWW